MGWRVSFIHLLICSGLSLAIASSTHLPRLDAVDFQLERNAMVEELTGFWGGGGVTDKRVIAAMQKVPRHEFVPGNQRELAYANTPLPIGYGQTISQPFIVAYMSQIAQVSAGMKVLEVGTGSGYQAAILNELTDQVYSMEIITELAQRTKALFKKLGLNRINAIEGDGYYGWPEAMEFDRIVVTAAAAHIPPPLLKQLKPGGRMVIPVGPRWGGQKLMLVEKEQDGSSRTQSVLGVIFVPLTGGRSE